VTPHTPHTSRTLSAIAVLVVLLAAVAAALSMPGTAAAKGTKCGKEIVADWFDNGRIDRLYPLHCYEEAIDAIPQDIKDYANAADVIQHALQRALTGHLYRCKGCPDPSPGGSRSTGGGNAGGTEAAGPTPNASGPSSVPIPLLVLGGISLALLAAGGLGYYSRRHQAQSGDDSSDDDLSG
jgi:hypothetical protein